MAGVAAGCSPTKLQTKITKKALYEVIEGIGLGLSSSKQLSLSHSSLYYWPPQGSANQKSRPTRVKHGGTRARVPPCALTQVGRLFGAAGALLGQLITRLCKATVVWVAEPIVVGQLQPNLPWTYLLWPTTPNSETPGHIDTSTPRLNLTGVWLSGTPNFLKALFFVSL